MSKPERKLVKKTVIPVIFTDDNTQVGGLIHFPTENNPKAVVPNETQIVRRKHFIIYRNQTVRENEPQQEEARKKQIDLYQITIAPNRNKEKQFKVEVPISKGAKTAKGSYKSNQIFFRFFFNNSEGQLVLLNGIQDAKMQIISKGKNELTSRDRLDIQTSMMDKRRKEPISQGRFYDQQQENE